MVTKTPEAQDRTTWQLKQKAIVDVQYKNNDLPFAAR